MRVMPRLSSIDSISETVRPIIRAIDNPFATHHTDTLPFVLQHQSWENLWARLSKLGNRVAIVGPHGTGKTTLLEEIGRQLAQNESPNAPPFHLFVSRNSREHKRERQLLHRAGRQGRWLLIDGLERWSWWHRYRWLRYEGKAYRTVVTAHANTWIPTWHRTQTDWELLCGLLNQLVPDPDDRFWNAARGIWQKHSGNIRETLRGLYDWWAEHRQS